MSVLSSPAPRWRAVPTTALTWREWDGEVVVYNQQTGSTHLLDPLAGMVLHQLISAEAGMSVADLVAALTDDTTNPEPQDPTVVVATMLGEFDRLGLAHADEP